MKIPLLTDFQFAEPLFLWLLVIPIILILSRGKSYVQTSIDFPAIIHLNDQLKKANNGILRFSKIALPLSITLGTIALARPQKVTNSEVIEGEGVEIALAIDVSGSMKEPDFVVNGRRVDRLYAAKSVVKDFIKGRTRDRIGVIVFSGRPHTMGPLTMNHEWLNQMINEEIHFERFENVIEGGTAIGTAIAAASKRLSEREAKSKIVVLLTDGVQSVPGLTPEDAAKLSATLGIKVYTIAIGRPGQSRSAEESFDLPTLRKVASITGAKNYLGRDTESLKAIFSEIDDLETSDIEYRQIIRKKEYFQWPTLIAASLLLISISWKRPAPE
jgi:Ca-activated chloride channel family protein